MRRLTISLALLFLAASASAIDTRTHAGPLRIGILDSAGRSFGPRESQMSELVRGAIRNALRGRGFDAFTARECLDDLRNGSDARADYWVEIAASRGETRPVAGVAVPVAASVGVEWEILVDRVAADVRLYDARTLDEIRTFDLRQRSTSVAPSAVLVSRSIWAAVALPIFEWTRHRGAIRDLGEEAAAQIAEELGR